MSTAVVPTSLWCDDAVGAAQVVVVDRPRADADKLGIGYSQIHSMNPDVFYFHVPAWGHGSSLEGLPASPALVAAATGIMGTQISRSGEPMHHRLPLAAYATGVVAALACMAALRGRLVHGSPGQHIEVWTPCLVVFTGSTSPNLAVLYVHFPTTRCQKWQDLWLLFTLQIAKC